MTIHFREAFFLVVFSFSLLGNSLAQTSSVSDRTTEFAKALLLARSTSEQDVLLTGQNEFVDVSLLAALKSSANEYIRKGDYVEAQRISHIAVKSAEIIGDRLALGRALCDLGSVYGRQMNRSTESIDYLQKSLVIFAEVGNKKEQARALQALGVAYGLTRRYEEALKQYDKSIVLSREVGDRNLTALTLNSLGLAHSSLGHYEMGLDFYQQSRRLSEELNDRGTLQMALNNIATHYINQGRFAEALDLLLRSLKIVEELGNEGDRRSFAYKLQNIGTVYRHQGNLDQALVYSRKSLSILEEIDDKFGIANLQNNMGVIYKSGGQFDLALEWFKKSLTRFEALPANGGVARCLNNLGDVYRLQKRFQLAHEPLQKSLALREQSRDRGGVALTLNNLAQLYQDEGKYPQMLETSQRSAKLAEEINAPEELWKAQDRIGKAQAALGHSGDARESFAAAIKTLEALRRNVAGTEQQQQSFLEDKLSPWYGLVSLLVEQNELGEALFVAEQSKARVLLDALQSARPNLRQSLSEKERQLEEEYRLRLVSLNSQLTAELRKDKSDASRVAVLKSDIEKSRLEYEDFETRVYVAHPELRTQRGKAPIVKPGEVAELLPDASSALLEYVVGEEKTYLFVVTKSSTANVDIKVYTLSLKRGELAAQTEALRKQLAQRDLGFRSSAAKLYQLLIEPAEEQLRGKTKLIVVPDRTLWDLPFQALVNGVDRFLLQDTSIAYAPSLTVLRDMTRRIKPVDQSATLFALGNPALKQQANHRVDSKLRDGKLAPLPESEEEVKALGRLYGQSRSSVYVGPEAREDRVKREAGRARILHFATHGVLNNASPMYSYLALAEGGTKEDGLLEAWELMNLDLRADLAVLSACETARGKVGAGEGMIGFSWAMFIAGVPSVVVSQWKVESAGTRDLMVNFHRSLLAPQSASKPAKAEALRQAALKVMKNPETSHPFYWAGFVLIGDGG